MVADMAVDILQVSHTEWGPFITVKLIHLHSVFQVVAIHPADGAPNGSRNTKVNDFNTKYSTEQRIYVYAMIL